MVQNQEEFALQQQINCLLDANGDALTQEQLDDVKIRLTQLKAVEEEDVGPLYPCVVFHDGDKYVACVDSQGVMALPPGIEVQAQEGGNSVKVLGDMSALEPMAEYDVNQEYRQFSDLCCLNYGIHVYDDGKVLSIVTDVGAHASHVAGIVAANHPAQPELNGVAPGAQIVSLKIGDTRLGSMETGLGLTRALLQAKKSGCHIINMSYGEATSWEDEGVFIRLAEELVNKHGILFVSSAGNNGPCLSTVGCPGGTNRSIISVGAYVTKGLMETAYSMDNATLPHETNYTWSSVGPSPDGGRGVSLVAPGGAVTCVPSWTLNKSQLMNGTSMSSPNCCGCISLLLSGCIANDYAYTPTSIRGAVEHTAKFCEHADSLGQGFGLIQVMESWKCIVGSKEKLLIHSASSFSYDDIPFKVQVNSERFTKGIYLRQPQETSVLNTFKVNISPMFESCGYSTEDSADASTTGAIAHGPLDKINYEQRIVLKKSMNDGIDFIRCPQKVLMTRSGKLISITVDPRNLTPGVVYSEYVRGYVDDGEDGLTEGKPFLFDIPIVVVKPVVIAPGIGEYCLNNPYKPLVFDDSTVRVRNFIAPPEGCQYVDVIVSDTRQLQQPKRSTDGASETSSDTSVYDSELSCDGDGTDDSTVRMIVLHALQVFNGTPYKHNEKQVYIQMKPGITQVVSFCVTAGVTMELCLGKFWSTVSGIVSCDVKLRFRGVTVCPNSFVIQSGRRVSELIRVSSSLVPQVEISPVAKLDKWHSVISPVNLGVVRPLLGDSRDDYNAWSKGGMFYHSILDYSFTHVEGSSLDVVPRFPGLQGILYESQYHAQFFKVYDVTDTPVNGKRMIGFGDSWPDKITIKAKGKYLLRLQLRHEKAEALEALNDLPMVLERSLKTSIPISFFKSQSDAIDGKNKMNTRGIFCGSSISMHMREPDLNQLPKGAVSGDILMGSVFFMKKTDNSSLGAGQKPNGYPLKYVVGVTKAPAALPSPIVSKAVSKGSSVETSQERENGTDKDSSPTTKSADAELDDSAAGGCESESASKSVPVASDEEAYIAAIKTARVNYVKTLCGKNNFMDRYHPLEVEYSDDMDICVIGLDHALAMAAPYYYYNDKPTQKYCDSVVETVQGLYTDVLKASDKLISLINPTELAASLGLNIDNDDKKAVEAKKLVEKKRDNLVNAYLAKALVSIQLAHTVSGTPEAEEHYINAFTVYYGELCKWEKDVGKSAKCWRLVVEKFKRNKQWGAAYAKIQEMIKSNSIPTSSSSDKYVSSIGCWIKSELHEEKVFILQQLKWMHVIRYMYRSNILVHNSSSCLKYDNTDQKYFHGSF